MGLLRGLFGRGKSVPDSGSVAGTEYAICPRCGAGYDTKMVMASLMMKDAWLADLSTWTTRITCRHCGSAFAVSGSFGTVAGQPKPG